MYARGGLYGGSWNTFRTFGPAQNNRFDHHLPPPHHQQRAIFYAADSGLTCIAEYFQRTRTIDVLDREPWLVGFALIEKLTLLDLTGAWPTAAGASMAINSGPRPRARRWSQAIYSAYPQAQGLYYASSMHANKPAMALYERAQAALPIAPFFHRALADPVLFLSLHNAAGILGYRFP